MSNPLLRAFFVGRALADAIYEQAENTFAEVMSEVGKFDAEQREKLRNFAAQVLERATQAEAAATQGSSLANSTSSAQAVDLQETIDNLRAEIAQVRAELKRYRSSNPQ